VGKLVVSEFVTLDGVFEDPGGAEGFDRGGWAFEQADWTNSTVIRDGVADAVRSLAREVDGDLLVNGSGRLVEALMAEDLVDEYRLMVFPVVLGAGRTLFGGATAKLRLAATQNAGETVILTYVR